jgi:hypothetical protein
LAPLVGVNVLLRQPHGFEGFAHLTVLANLGNPTVTHSVRVGLALIERRTAGASSANKTCGDDYEVPSIDAVVDLDVPLDRFKEVGQETRDAFVTPMDIRTGIVCSVPPLDLGVAQIQQCFQILAVDRVDSPANDLHVLLRNTPSPGPQNGYFMGRV